MEIKLMNQIKEELVLISLISDIEIIEYESDLYVSVGNSTLFSLHYYDIPRDYELVIRAQYSNAIKTNNISQLLRIIRRVIRREIKKGSVA